MQKLEHIFKFWFLLKYTFYSFFFFDCNSISNSLLLQNEVRDLVRSTIKVSLFCMKLTLVLMNHSSILKQNKINWRLKKVKIDKTMSVLNSLSILLIISSLKKVKITLVMFNLTVKFYFLPIKHNSLLNWNN